MGVYEVLNAINSDNNQVEYLGLKVIVDYFLLLYSFFQTSSKYFSSLF